MSNKLLAIGVLSISLLGTGCVSSLSGESYSREDARVPQTVRTGTVQSARLVKIEGTKTAIGPAAGAIVGGVAGSSVGGGKGAIIAATVGAVAGGLAGAATEHGLTATQGVEIVVKEDTGQTRAYVQAADDKIKFSPGERVNILSVNGQTRLSKVVQ
ncbi:MAG: glycine zipper 2TM domain-containing protein [Porticoccaceae bacterium]